MTIITATYEIHGADARARAEAVAVEQSHELPTAFAPPLAMRSLAHVVDFVEDAPGPALTTIEYPADLAGDELTQLLVLLIGNVSLQDGVRLVDVRLPAGFAATPGPRLGVAGIRRILGVPDRPLIATAIKPVGLGIDELEQMAYELAAGGIDVVKEDQGLANQPWAPFSERIVRLSAAVARANSETGGTAVYLPTVSGPGDLFVSRLHEAVDAGAGGALVLPGVGGIDQLAQAAGILGPDRIVLAHPAFLGGFTASATHGISPELLFGTLLRVAGADSVIFPSYGGRFSLTEQQCAGIAARSAAPLEGVRASLPAPGGGMAVDRVPELVELYGKDVLLLIGSDLHRDGDLRGASAVFREAVERI